MLLAIEAADFLVPATLIVIALFTALVGFGIWLVRLGFQVRSLRKGHTSQESAIDEIKKDLGTATYEHGMLKSKIESAEQSIRDIRNQQRNDM